MRKLSATTTTFVLATLTVGTACGVFGSGDDEAPAAAPAPAPTDTGGSSSGGGNGPPPPPPPPVDGKPITGVFVSSSLGADTNDGTIARPLKSLARAMTKAKESNQAVIACAEPFSEALVLINGVTLYGYFDCNTPDWKRATTKHAVVSSPTSPAVLADKLDLQARIEGFEFIAPDIGGKAAADKVARSSIGMLVKQSKGLSMADVVIRGGSAEAGADGVENAELNVGTGPVVPVASQQYAGCPYNPSVCAVIDHGNAISPPSAQTCKYGAPGGSGGQGGDCVLWVDGIRRTPFGHDFGGKPFAANASTAAGGGANIDCTNACFGLAGAKGGPGTPGNNGVWSFDGEGFLPGNGSAGAIGEPGQGGGGGAGNFVWRTQAGATAAPPAAGYAFGGTGGSGGAGGCGGLPGTPGRGGGASIGLLSLDSQLAVKTSRIEAGAGGAAGKGALGQVGTSGLPANQSVGFLDYRFGSPGGDGGAGGEAGPSGHGSAGPSIAFAFKGARPNVDPTATLTPGTPGAGQAALARGTSVVAAVVGEAKPEHGF